MSHDRSVRWLLLGLAVIVLFVGGCGRKRRHSRRPPPPPPTLDEGRVHTVLYGRDVDAFKALLADRKNRRLTTASGQTLLHLVASTSGPTLDVDTMEATGQHAEPGKSLQSLPHLATDPLLEMAQAALDRGLDLEARDQEGQTPLLCAARAGGAQMLRFLLGKGAQATVTTSNGATALHLLGSQGSADAGQALLDAGCHVNAADHQGRTPLFACASSGTSRLMELLLQHGAQADARDRAGDTALHVAAGKPYLKTVSVLLAAGAQVDTRGAQGRTPLHAAAAAGQTETARLLLKSGASVKATDDEGRTPAALVRGNPLLAQMLSASVAGAKGGATDDALFQAVLANDVAAVRQCLARGANANALSPTRDTPLLRAAEVSDDPGLIGALVKAGAKLEARGSRFAMTPLLVALYDRHPHAAAALLAAGANVKATSSIGQTPLHLACLNGYPELVPKLLARGAPVAAQTTEGLTPLHEAAMSNSVPIAQQLLQHGAPVNARDKRGQTPLDAARDHGEMQEFLEQHGGKAGV